VAKFSSVWFGMVRFCSVRSGFDIVWFGSVSSSVRLVVFGSVRCGLVWSIMV